MDCIISKIFQSQYEIVLHFINCDWGVVQGSPSNDRLGLVANC